jgi:hypothetical protein
MAKRGKAQLKELERSMSESSSDARGSCMTRMVGRVFSRESRLVMRRQNRRYLFLVSGLYVWLFVSRLARVAAENKFNPVMSFTLKRFMR